MTPATPETELTPELIERVMKLSAESKDRLLGMMLDELGGPPDNRSDEEIAAEIKRRSDEYHAGTARLMTREESEAAIRDRLRSLGVEL